MSSNKYTVMVAAMQPPEEKARQCLIPKIVILAVVTDIIISLQNEPYNIHGLQSRLTRLSWQEQCLNYSKDKVWP